MAKGTRADFPVVASAGQEIYGTLYWDPTQIINRWDNRAAAFFCSAAL